MRPVLWLLVTFAGTGDAQWRHFSDEPAAVASAALAREMLAAHNAVRAHAGVPPLAWSDQLARLSQDWAQKLLSHKQFKHRPDSKYGENLFEISGAGASPAEVVRYWAMEAVDYDYASNHCRRQCGHYTQLVWADTREVGCAVARNRERAVWVCNYDPPGNWIGKRPY
jgi:pathogenesis-related protein 1